ncbi:hypothetical protein EKO04_010942 [Ascochyta lentis]|uniref:Uncharacterized protein n=1 Tax=Ascochyta lentis TaxID=205686 RepID=A0A8H7ISD1_9PLEO|nr:hypothetical protein EKO04_010942 [Ascochyta lentis]
MKSFFILASAGVALVAAAPLSRDHLNTVDPTSTTTSLVPEVEFPNLDDWPILGVADDAHITNDNNINAIDISSIIQNIVDLFDFASPADTALPLATRALPASDKPACDSCESLAFPGNLICLNQCKSVQPEGGELATPSPPASGKPACDSCESLPFPGDLICLNQCKGAKLRYIVDSVPSNATASTVPQEAVTTQDKVYDADLDARPPMSPVATDTNHVEDSMTAPSRLAERAGPESLEVKEAHLIQNIDGLGRVNRALLRMLVVTLPFPIDPPLSLPELQDINTALVDWAWEFMHEPLRQRAIGDQLITFAQELDPDFRMQWYDSFKDVVDRTIQFELGEMARGEDKGAAEAARERVLAAQHESLEFVAR